MLRGSYENAYSMYKRGNYSGAREVASRILAIDPSFEDAAMLHEITEQLATGVESQKDRSRILEEKFKEALERAENEDVKHVNPFDLD